MNKKVDILVVYWETDIFIDKCINQLLKTDYDNYQIYIVDNTCKNKRKLRLKFNSKKIKIIDGVDPKKRTTLLKRGRHHVDGLQIGINKTNSEYISIFHADSWPIDNFWLKKCLKYINLSKVWLVGVQHESSIHSCFHFFKRDILKKLNYHYNKKKKLFTNSSLKKYIKYQEGIKKSRKGWDWGEDFSIKIYKNGKYTIGFNPTKGFSIGDKVKEKKYCSWRKFGADGYGIVYGDMFFHVWKSFRKISKNKLLKYKNLYEEDKYLKSYYYVDDNYDKIIINKGIHDNFCYAFHKKIGFNSK